jgi:hypothetical protein
VHLHTHAGLCVSALTQHSTSHVQAVCQLRVRMDGRHATGQGSTRVMCGVRSPESAGAGPQHTRHCRHTRAPLALWRFSSAAPTRSSR